MPFGILTAIRAGYVGFTSNPSYTKFRLNLTIPTNTGSLIPGKPLSTFWVKYGRYSSNSNIVDTLDQTVYLDTVSQNTGSIEFDFPPKDVYSLKGYGIDGNTGILWTTDTININTYTPPDVPPQPSALIVEINGIPRIRLSIKSPSHWGGGSPSYYNIMYFSPEDDPSVRRFQNIGLGGLYPTNPLNFTFSNLTLIPNKNYVFKVSAKNAEVGLPSAWSEESKPISLNQSQVPSTKGFLFDRSTWNNSILPQKIKNQFNKAADSWETYVTISPEIIQTIQKSFPNFRGIFGTITTFNDANKYAVACFPKSCSVSLEDRPKLITIEYSLKINTALFNTLTDYDWELALTHHLGHALGLGVQWYLDYIYDYNLLRSEKSFNYPTYQLSSKVFNNAQNAYNKMKVPPFKSVRKFIPLDHVGPDLTDDIVGFDGTPNSTEGLPPQNYLTSGIRHWGLFRNTYTRFTTLHPTDHIKHDIMAYRYPNQDKMITLLSIKALVDLGYSEVVPNSYQTKPSTMPLTTITNKELCSYYDVTDGPLIQSTEDTLSLEPTIDLIINKDNIIINLEPDDVNPCTKWYCSESGCGKINKIEFFGDGTLYDSLEECEESCTDSAGILSNQYVFDSESLTWRTK